MSMKKTKLYIDKHMVTGKVDKRIYGSFIEHLGRAVYGGIYQPGQSSSDDEGLRNDVADLVKELGVEVVRYPGGNFVSGYNWEDGVGPKDARPQKLDLAWKVIETNRFGINEFADWCRKADTQPMIAVNLGTRGIDEARDLVEYCNIDKGGYYSDLRRSHGYEKPHDFKLWCLGNEMDGPWQIGHKTASEYGRLASETGRAMRAVDPDIELVCCGSSSHNMDTFGKWEDEVLSLCYDEADYLSLHAYYDNEKDNTPDFLASTVDMDSFISSVVSICDSVKAKLRRSKSINLSFDEWNVWYHSKEQDKNIEKWCSAPHALEDVYNFEDALLTAGLMITLLRHADRVRIACIAQLVNVIAPIMTSDKGAWKQTIYYPFELISRYGRGTVLTTIVDTPVYDSIYGDAPYVDSVCVYDEENEALTIFIVNKDLVDDMELSVDLRQFEGYSLAEHFTLYNDDLKAVNTEDKPDNVIPVKGSGIRIEGGVLQGTIKSKSFNVIRLKR